MKNFCLNVQMKKLVSKVTDSPLHWMPVYRATRDTVCTTWKQVLIALEPRYSPLHPRCPALRSYFISCIFSLLVQSSIAVTYAEAVLSFRQCVSRNCLLLVVLWLPMSRQCFLNFTLSLFVAVCNVVWMLAVESVAFMNVSTYF